MQLYSLQNDRVRLTVAEDGTLRELTSVQTGHNCLVHAHGPFWKMVFRGGASLENALWSTGQAVDAIEQSEGRLSLRYDRLYWNGAELAVRAEFHFELQGDEIHTWAEVTNNSELILAELWFPLVQGVRGVSNVPEEEALILPHGFGRRIDFPLQNLGSDATNTGYSHDARQINLLYPGAASMPWLALSHRTQTLSLTSFDPDFHTTGLHVRRSVREGALRLAIVRFVEVSAGRRRVPPAVISLHRGDWHVTARRYRGWLERQLEWPAPPIWIRDMPAWQLTIMRQQYGKVFWDYEGLRELWAGAKQAGIDTLMLFGWYDSGHDNLYPEGYAVSKVMGGQGALRAAVQEIQADGGRVILYTQGRLIDPATDFYQRIGKSLSSKSIWGTEYREQYRFFLESAALAASNGKSFAIACPSNPQWEEVLMGQAREVAQLAVDGVLYDQLGGSVTPYLCYDPSHPHTTPASGYARPILSTMRKIRSELKAHDPEFALVTENISDVLCSAFDITHGGGFGCRSGPEVYPNVFRYTVPHTIATSRMVYNNELADLYFSFFHGFRFDLEPHGALGHMGSDHLRSLAERVHHLCAVRRRYKRSLLRGAYVDTDGVELAGELSDASAMDVKAFRGEGEGAVVFWNRRAEPVSVLPTFEGERPTQMIGLTHPDRKKGDPVRPGEQVLFVYDRLESSSPK